MNCLLWVIATVANQMRVSCSCCSLVNILRIQICSQQTGLLEDAFQFFFIFVPGNTKDHFLCFYLNLFWTFNEKFHDYNPRCKWRNAPKRHEIAYYTISNRSDWLFSLRDYKKLTVDSSDYRLWVNSTLNMSSIISQHKHVFRYWVCTLNS